MSRLFLRIFLWFWLGSTVLFVVLAVSVIVAEPDIITTWRFIGRTGMRYVGAHVADVYEQRGAAAATDVLAGISAGRFRAWLYTGDGRFIAGPAPIADVRAVIDRARAGDDDAGRALSRDAWLLAQRALGHSGAEYVMIWDAPRPLRGYAQMSPLRLASRLGALALTSGVICWLLTWQITRPIGVLRSAARRFADGDLAVRVSSSRTLQRGDELADLAAEFDRMAARIQALITSQQQLLADMSHELRSPLARLSLALDLARRRIGEVPEHERMARELQRLDDLIGQLLTLARLRGQTGSPAFERISLHDLVQEVTQDASFEARSLGRLVTLDGDAGITVRANRSLLRSALDNVVRNALRYAPDGSAVTITMEAREGGAAIVVRDRGPGVPPQALARLFDPFFRVEDSRDRASGGIGLGLAIARHAMATHGGSATAQNHPEGGLVVRLELPVTPGESAGSLAPGATH